MTLAAVILLSSVLVGFEVGMIEFPKMTLGVAGRSN